MSILFSSSTTSRSTTSRRALAVLALCGACPRPALAANMAPVIDLNGAGTGIDNSVSYIEPINTTSGNAQTFRPLIANMALVTEDGTTPNTIFSMTIRITNLQDGNAESLSVSTTGTMISPTYDAATGELYLRGGDNAANFQKVLRTVRYRNTSENPGTVARRILVTADDFDGATSTPATVTVSVTAVNDPPLAVVANDGFGTTVPQSTSEDTPLTLAVTGGETGGNGIGVGDFDDAGQVEEVQISVSNGTLTLKQTTGLTFSQGDGSGDAAMTFRGTVPFVTDAQGFLTPGGTVGAALQTVIYTPNPNFNGQDSLVISINDLGNTGSGGPMSASATLPISVTAVNDAPVNTLPSAATTERNTNLIFSSARGNGIRISDADGDADGAAGNFSLSLTATQGRLMLSQTPAGVSVSGDGTSNLVLSGNLTDLNAALEGLTFVPSPDYTGDGAGITLVTSESGAGALSDSDSVAINVLAPAARSGAIISEFRFRGPGGSGDEYVELFNTQGTPLDISGWTIQIDTATGPDPIQSVTAPPSSIIPARGHFLFTGPSYSLSAYGAGDQSFSFDALDDSGVALFNGVGEKQDAVGFTSSNNNLREGAGLAAAPTVDGEYAFMRDFDNSQPKNSADSTNDFVLVSTLGVPLAGPEGQIATQLGAPNPQGKSSPLYANDMVTTLLLDPNAPQTAAPNRVRAGSGNSGSLTIRRTLVNKTGRTLNRVRFSVTRITSDGSALQPGQTLSSQAVIRLTSSTSGNVLLSDGVTSVPVSGTTLEAPSASTPGGGLGSSATFDAVLATPLPPNESRNYAFLLNIVKSGAFTVIFNIEALPTQ